jgi:pyridoxal phosphate enzyme (YggS family)
MITEKEFQNNLSILRERLAEACALSNRSVEEVQILPVTKNWPVQAVHYSQRAGFSRVGENRVQEALEKKSSVEGMEWDLIGHLQSNKAKQVIGQFSRVQTVDSSKLLGKLHLASTKLNVKTGILIQVNTGNDPAKNGILEEQCEEFVEKTLGYSSLILEGFMTMAPFAPDDPKVARNAFSRLRNLKDQMSSQFNIPLPELSMGMTGDLGEAVAEGSTMIRVGSALFGQRE